MTNVRLSAFGIAVSLSSVAALLTGARLDAQSSPITRSVTSALKWGPCPAIFPTGCQIAVLNGDPSKPNADVFLRVPGGYTIPAHSHTSAERMVLVEGQLTVTYKGASAAALAPGVYAYGPAKLPHEAKCAGNKPCTLFIAFEGPVDATAYVGTLK
ncbi:cupin domain-containing protein [Gemmatimonas sp.]|uniref:cupin domain-containing protein n=1 Tax=Gemmatimonas sp. TaxID=1962908 RepID=UPI00286CDCE4|nr:cupin domain-containing protein [Gemmatimonas sp.]